MNGSRLWLKFTKRNIKINHNAAWQNSGRLLKCNQIYSSLVDKVHFFLGRQALSVG